MAGILTSTFLRNPNFSKALLTWASVLYGGSFFRDAYTTGTKSSLLSKPIELETTFHLLI